MGSPNNILVDSQVIRWKKPADVRERCHFSWRVGLLWWALISKRRHYWRKCRHSIRNRYVFRSVPMGLKNVIGSLLISSTRSQFVLIQCLAFVGLVLRWACMRRMDPRPTSKKSVRDRRLGNGPSPVGRGCQCDCNRFLFLILPLHLNFHSFLTNSQYLYQALSRCLLPMVLVSLKTCLSIFGIVSCTALDSTDMLEQPPRSRPPNIKSSSLMATGPALCRLMVWSPGTRMISRKHMRSFRRWLGRMRGSRRGVNCLWSFMWV